MGANAQTTVPTFVAGQVLTAEQQRQSAGTGVPVFADTTARDAGFGSAGEKVLAEGQLCYLESTNVVQYYDGAAWATVGPQTLTSGLNYITGATFTTATSFSLPNSTFTTTYRNYRVMVQITALTADATFTMRLRASGTDNTTASYRTAGYGGSSLGTIASVVGNAQTSWNFAEQDAGFAGYALTMDLFSPQVATFTAAAGQYNYFLQTPAGTQAIAFTAHHDSTTQFDALSFISSIASSMTGIYRVYGYSDS